MNRTPHVVATSAPDQRPTRASVAEARFAEAKAITLALLERLDREQEEWRAAPFVEKFRVAQRMEATRVLLLEAGDHEDRSFAAWEHERSLVAGRPVVGVRGDATARRAHQPASTSSELSKRLLRPPVVVGSTSSRRTA